jgi:hypothetical protein
MSGFKVFAITFAVSVAVLAAALGGLLVYALS